MLPNFVIFNVNILIEYSIRCVITKLLIAIKIGYIAISYISLYYITTNNAMGNLVFYAHLTLKKYILFILILYL